MSFAPNDLFSQLIGGYKCNGERVSINEVSMRTATINTIIDGHDAGQINAWSVNDGSDNRKIKGYFKQGEQVDVMATHKDYVEIRGIGHRFNVILDTHESGVKVRGWVHKAFLNDTETTT